MLIDCDRCEMRNVACDDCVVGALLGIGPTGELDAEMLEVAGLAAGEANPRDLDPETTSALRVLADGGLVPPLRMQWPDAASG